MFYKLMVILISIAVGIYLVKLYRQYCSKDRMDVFIASFLAAGISLFLVLLFFDMHLKAGI